MSRVYTALHITAYSHGADGKTSTVRLRSADDSFIAIAAGESLRITLNHNGELTLTVHADPFRYPLKPELVVFRAQVATPYDAGPYDDEQIEATG